MVPVSAILYSEFLCFFHNRAYLFPQCTTARLGPNIRDGVPMFAKGVHEKDSGKNPFTCKSYLVVLSLFWFLMLADGCWWFHTFFESPIFGMVGPMVGWLTNLSHRGCSQAPGVTSDEHRFVQLPPGTQSPLVVVRNLGGKAWWRKWHVILGLLIFKCTLMVPSNTDNAENCCSICGTMQESNNCRSGPPHQVPQARANRRC